MKPARLWFAPLVVLAGCASEPTPQAPVAKAAPTVETPAPKPPTPSPPAEPTKEAKAPSLATLVKDAKAEGKLPLLVFSTVWCGPCETLEKEVLPKEEVVKALGPFRLQKYDAEIGEGFAAAQKFGIASYPTMVFLSADGDEVARMTAPTQPSFFIETLNAKLVLAKAGKPSGSDGDASNDPRKVLAAAQAEDARPDVAKAKKLYATAQTLATKQKEPEVVAEATFALLQIEARERDRKEHATRLLAFVKAHPSATKTLDALEGIAGLASDAGVKPADVKASVSKLETAFVAAHKDVELRRLGAVLKKLGDEDGAKRLEVEATKEGANKPTTPEMFRFADPLGTKFTFSMGGKGQGLSAQAAFPGMTSRQLVEDCHHLPHPSESIPVRVYTASGAITKAVVLDPELPLELRTCLEKSATSMKTVPTGAPEKAEIRVTFAPAKH